MQNFEQIWAEAQQAANAVPKYIDRGIQGPCGFAWITIPGRGKFAKWAKEHLRTHKNYNAAGYNIWYSTVYDCKGNQNVDDHEMACREAAVILRKYGIDAYVSSRLD